MTMQKKTTSETSSFKHLFYAYDTTMVRKNGQYWPTKDELAPQIVHACNPELKFQYFLKCAGEATLFVVSNPSLNDRLQVLKIPRVKLQERDRERFSRSACLLAAQRSDLFPFVINLSLDPLFLELEWIEGTTLRDWVESDKYSLSKALDLYRQILRGVSIFHAEDITHRDLRPDNIIVTPDNKIRIIDFGLAKVATDTTVTRIGDSLGVESYVPPEQEDNPALAIHTTADVYALGKILYYLLCRDDHNFSTTTLLTFGYTPQVTYFYQTACNPVPSKRFPKAQHMVKAFNELFPLPTLSDSRTEGLLTWLEDLLVLCAGDRLKVELFSGMTREELFPIWNALKEQRALACLNRDNGGKTK